MERYKRKFEENTVQKLKRLLDKIGIPYSIEDKPNEIKVIVNSVPKDIDRVEAEVYEIFSDGKIGKKDVFISSKN